MYYDYVGDYEVVLCGFVMIGFGSVKAFLLAR